MSRSYKHTPYCGDTKNKYMKRYATKRFKSLVKRQNLDDEIAPGMYKRYFCSWDICDYYTILTLKEHLMSYRDEYRYGTYVRDDISDEEKIKRWKKDCLWK
ncbi:MAG: hypothetical protein IJI57_04530 [Flexilinea sp.]|nr:hypothetical protein [Flexilinea sp.]